MASIILGSPIFSTFHKKIEKQGIMPENLGAIPTYRVYRLHDMSYSTRNTFSVWTSRRYAAVCRKMLAVDSSPLLVITLELPPCSWLCLWLLPSLSLLLLPASGLVVCYIHNFRIYNAYACRQVTRTKFKSGAVV